MVNRVHMPLPPFDPAEGTVVLGPEKAEPGYWTGSPGVLHDGERYWLTYRQRRPRGAEAERGWRCAVAVGDDGVHFTDVWSVHKDELGTPSMERFCLTPGDDGGFRLFLSYVDPADNRWRIDALTAEDPSRFDVAARRPVLTAAATGTEGVKDPYVMRVGPVTYLFASFAEALSGLGAEAHATADIYNVGVTTHPTGLATSLDGETFTWHGTVLPVGAGWNRYQVRLNSVVRTAGGYVGFYDGSASHEENYEERCGIAVSADLFTWHRLSDEGPWVTAPHGTGSVRYVDALVVDGEWRIYYEMTRADGAHELRLIRLPAS
ncbi:hypothetical protein HNP84_003311 [Thermocatellispora tengchongensis]|uniref:Glycosyl hydrolase family 32 n=1 Tax=Thermocatellispora tengchongensis TaxID=1073253 RepID=A0A840PC40_9ACTN|nr:hypothetical protein [Thermocatellispora tengchongensis]MBB5133585.1 hypothetical protein [Thermocatellispora tengchongensis]